MRILRGKFKGKSLAVPAHTRPVFLRAKKACFDILADALAGGIVLDLFAGSGALGFEALSCGAERVVFVDKSPQAIKIIKKNLFSLSCSFQCEVYRKDSFQSIKTFALKKYKFDIIFLDPPYYKGLMRKILQTLTLYDIVKSFGYLVCFCSCQDTLYENEELFTPIVSKKYGQTLLRVYKKVF